LAVRQVSIYIHTHTHTHACTRARAHTHTHNVHRWLARRMNIETWKRNVWLWGVYRNVDNISILQGWCWVIRYSMSDVSRKCSCLIFNSRTMHSIWTSQNQTLDCPDRSLVQGCTNPRCQVIQVTKFYMVVPLWVLSMELPSCHLPSA
jgi:hypothetical protein